MTRATGLHACWVEHPREAVLSKEAIQTDRAVFLASHSPITRLKVEQGELARATDEGLLEALKHRPRDLHTLVVVQGAPGSGKSHLIRWLHHRLEGKLGIDTPVFVERRDSSLRAVLSKLTDGLGMADLASKLEDAARNLNEAGRKGLFLSTLSNLLDPERVNDQFEGWQSAASLRLSEFLENRRVQQELIGPAGAVTRICKRLFGGAGAGEVREGEQEEFRVSDLEPLLRVPTGQFGSAAVSQTLGELRKSPAKLAEAVALINSRRRLAISTWFNLDNGVLVQRMAELRQKLAEKGRRLVLMIEDVSCFQGVDDQLIEALFHVNAKDASLNSSRPLAPLLAVVGVTTQYFEREIQPKGNATGRIAIRVSLSSDTDRDSGKTLSLSEEAEVAAFVGRYLNVLRTRSKDLQKWAKNLDLDHPSAAPSACRECSRQESCSAAFGTTADDYGLYPFNPRALRTIFNNLFDSEQKLALSTPRAMLDFLRFALDCAEGAHAQGAPFPPPELFAEKRLNMFGLPPASIARARTLEQQFGASEGAAADWIIRVWGENTNVEVKQPRGATYIGGVHEGVFVQLGVRAPRLGTKLAPPAPLARPPTPGGVAPQPHSPPPPPPPPQEHSEFAKREKDIQDWAKGKEELAYWGEFRKLLHRMLVDGVDWQAWEVPHDHVTAVFRVEQVGIEGRDSRGVALALPRTEQVRDVLLACLNTEFAAGGKKPLDPSDAAVYLHWQRAFVLKYRGAVIEFVKSTLPRNADGSGWNAGLAALQLLYVDLLLRNSHANQLPEGVVLASMLGRSPGGDDRSARNQHLMDIARRFAEPSGGRTVRERLQDVSRSWLNVRGTSSDRGDFLALHRFLPGLRAFRATLELSPAPEPGALSDGPAHLEGLRELAGMVAFVRDRLQRSFEEEMVLLRQVRTALGELGGCSLVELVEAVEKLCDVLNRHRSMDTSEVRRRWSQCYPRDLEGSWFGSPDKTAELLELIRAGEGEPNLARRWALLAEFPWDSLRRVPTMVSTARLIVERAGYLFQTAGGEAPGDRLATAGQQLQSYMQRVKAAATAARGARGG